MERKKDYEPLGDVHFSSTFCWIIKYLCTCNKLYAYDRSGNVIASINGSNIVDYSYDPFGNVLTIQGRTNASKYISYTYDGDNLRQSKTVNGETN